ncbi:MAG TPA: hypothetical protein DCR55_18260 [Lentisphaeria bacterium]|jgi:hypothetical protein|nr:hypothetical protein [Lentisphaeria bacterium]
MRLDCYYLLASLPSLKFPGKPPVASEEFLATCRTQLGDADYALVDSATLELCASEHPVLTRWRDWDAGVRNSLAALRARKLSWPARDSHRAVPMANTSYAWLTGVVEAPSPLEGERLLDKARWRFLHDLQAGQAGFDLIGVVIYRLQLQLLERWARFDVERGREVLAGIMNRE